MTLKDALAQSDALIEQTGVDERMRLTAAALRAGVANEHEASNNVLTITTIVLLEALAKTKEDLAAAVEANAQLRREFEALKSQIVRKDR